MTYTWARGFHGAVARQSRVHRTWFRLFGCLKGWFLQLCEIIRFVFSSDPLFNLLPVYSCICGVDFWDVPEPGRQNLRCFGEFLCWLSGGDASRYELLGSQTIDPCAGSQTSTVHRPSTWYPPHTLGIKQLGKQTWSKVNPKAPCWAEVGWVWTTPKRKSLHFPAALVVSPASCVAPCRHGFSQLIHKCCCWATSGPRFLIVLASRSEHPHE